MRLAVWLACLLLACSLDDRLLHPVGAADDAGGDADADSDADLDAGGDGDIDADGDVDAGVDAGADAGPAECQPGEARACGTTNVGACQLGTQSCAAGAWGSCQDAMEPAAETCDGADQDCDGADDLDDPDANAGCVGAACTSVADLGITACVRQAECDGNWQTCCDDAPCSPGETCAGISDCGVCGKDQWGCDCFICYEMR